MTEEEKICNDRYKTTGNINFPKTGSVGMRKAYNKKKVQSRIFSKLGMERKGSIIQGLH